MQTSVYIIYLGVSSLLTIWLGRTLFRAGRPFLDQMFAGNVALAESCNQLLLVGFYLLNSALIGMTLREAQTVTTVIQATDLIFLKLGRTLLVLGLMHFFNLITISIRCWIQQKLLARQSPR